MFVCDNCKSKDTVVKNYEFEFEVNSKKYSVSGKRRYCKSCNSLVYDSELDNDILKKALRKKEEILGVEPEKIIDLRKSYNLSQDDFSKIIGCAKKTLISYEKGTSIPNDSYLIAIKMLLDDPLNIKLLIKANLDRFTDKELKRINNKLNLDIFELDDNKLDCYNGYIKFDFNKMKNIIKYLTKDGMLKTKLLKELFYIDFLYFKENAVSLTGSVYKKYKFGPVPNNYETVLNELVIRGEIDIDCSFMGDYECFNIISKNNDIELESDEIDLIDKVMKFFEKYTATDIKDYSHKEKAYINKKDFDSLDYNDSEYIDL